MLRDASVRGDAKDRNVINDQQAVEAVLSRR